MMRYRISYVRDGAEKVCIRKAETAREAVEKLMAQHGWHGHVTQYDADTWGKEWAKYSVQTERYSYDYITVTAMAI